MRTTKIVYIILWAITVLPLIIFNLNKIIVRKDDGIHSIKLGRLIVILILAIFITMTLLRTYTISIDYQPKLVSDRFITSLSKDSFDEAKNTFDKLLYEDMDSELLHDIYNDVPKNGGRYQLGENVAAKYFFDKPYFPSVNVTEDQTDVVCVVLRIDQTITNDDDEYSHYILRLRKVDDIKWRIDACIEANEEAVKYADRYNLIKHENAGTWYKF